jgi:hypothetical protein
VLTLEHAFGPQNQARGRPALQTEIRNSIFCATISDFLETNIQYHEQPESTRTSLFAIFGETDKFVDFETLLEKCLHADRTRRPRTAIKLREEAIFLDFLNRLENGEQPCDLVRPPFEDEKDTKIRILKKELKNLNKQNEVKKQQALAALLYNIKLISFSKCFRKP